MVVGGVVQCDSQNTEKTHSLTRFLGNLGCICVWVELGSGLLMRWTLPPLARSGNSSSSWQMSEKQYISITKLHLKYIYNEHDKASIEISLFVTILHLKVEWLWRGHCCL